MTTRFFISLQYKYSAMTNAELHDELKRFVKQRNPLKSIYWLADLFKLNNSTPASWDYFAENQKQHRKQVAAMIRKELMFRRVKYSWEQAEPRHASSN